jgi:hypothetical protein
MRSAGCRGCVSKQAPDARLCEVRRYWRVETADPRDGRSGLESVRLKADGRGTAALELPASLSIDPQPAKLIPIAGMDVANRPYPKQNAAHSAIIWTIATGSFPPGRGDVVMPDALSVRASTAVDRAASASRARY